MRNKIISGLTGLLLPFAAYGAPATYGNYQHRKLVQGVSHQPLHSPGLREYALKDPVQIRNDEQLNISSGTLVKELVIIGAKVPDRSVLQSAARPGVETVILTHDRDALAQITEILESHSNLDAIHLVSHGEPGVILLGEHRLDKHALKAQPQFLESFNQATRPGADLLLYGCDLAAEDAELLELIQRKTHLDVAASNNPTGSSSLGGDWDLEVQAGNIETSLPFSAKALKDFSGILAPDGIKTFESLNYQVYETNPSISFGDFTVFIESNVPEILNGTNTSCSGDLYVSMYEYTTSSRFYIRSEPSGDSFAVTQLILRRPGDRPTTSVNIKGFDSVGSTTPVVHRDNVTIAASGTTTVDLTSGFTGSGSFGNIAKLRIEPLNNINFCLNSITFTEAASGNNPPTDIHLSSASVNQSGGTNAVVGTLSTEDDDIDDTHIYTLVAGAGDTDFNINGDQLRANNAAALAAGTYNVSIQTDDGTDTFEKSFTITVVDDIAPTVTSVSVPASGTYNIGQNLDFTVNLSENVDVSGTPRIALTIGAETRYASYLAGSGTSALVFRHTVQSGDTDNDGIEVGATLDLNGGTIRDGANNDMTTALNAIGDTSAILVDTSLPTVTSGNISISGATGTGGVYKIGDTVTATWNNTAAGDNNSATVTGVTVDFTEFGGGAAVVATNSSGTWTATHALVAGAIEATNRNVSISATNANGTTTVADTTNATVDNVAPSGHSVSFDSGIINAADATSISFTFAGAEVGAGYSYTVTSSGGGAPVTDTGTIATATDQISGIDVSGLNDGTLTLSVTLTDAAGNAASAVTDTATLDGSAPIVNSVSVPANGTYGMGQNLDFTVNTNENVTVNTTGGTPRIALTIGATSREAVYLAGSGTSALVFRYTVQAGDADYDGIAVAANIDASGAALQDAAGNDMALTLNSVGDTSAVLVDTIAPVNTLPAAQITDSVTPLVFSSGNGNAISVSDDGNLTVVVSIDTGTLSASTGGSAGISNNGTGTVTITGTATEVNVALEGLTYTPDGAGTQTLNVLSTDGAGNSDEADLEITVDASTLVVTSSLDTGDDATLSGSFAADQADGDGLSIREALHWARPGDIITFDLDSGTPGNQGGTITLNGSELNIAYSDIRIDGDLSGDGIADVIVSGNNASRVMMVNSGLTGIELTGLTLTRGNSASGGGGLSLGVNANVTLRNVNITDSNDSSGQGGGGIYGSSVTLTLINSTVSGNSASSFGGGVHTVGTSTLNVINSTISDNITTGADNHGGGIQFAGATLTLVNSTISGNATTGANADGGGIRISTGTSYLYNATIVGNAAGGNGGGVSANGTDNFINTVVAGNTAGAGATAAVGGSPLATGGSPDDVSGTVQVAIHSYFGTSATITTDTNSLNNQGTSNLLLGDLANFQGSPIQTHRPLNGSALLEAGSNADLPPDTFDLNGNSDTTEPLPVDANGQPRVSGIVDIGAVEGAPAISSIGVPTDGTYTAGEHLDFTVHTPINVTVDTTDGTPRIALTVGTETRYAAYLSGSGTNAIVFRYTVQTGDNDSDGIAVDALELNGGTLRDDFDSDLNTTLYAVGDTSGVLVDAVAPTVSSVSVPSNGTYIAGEHLDFIVNMDEDVIVNTADGTPQIALTIGTITRQAVYLSGSGTAALMFRYTVQVDDSDTDGITVAGSLDANGGTLRDGAGNDLDTTLNSVGSTASVLVNTAPVITAPASAAVAQGSTTALPFSVNDPDNTTLSVTAAAAHGTLHITDAGGAAITGSGTGTVQLDGTLTQLNTALASLQFHAPAVYQGDTTVTVSATDAFNTTDASVTMTIAAVPTLDGLANTTVSYTRGDAAILLDSAGIGEVDFPHNTDFDGGSLHVRIIDGSGAGDLLSLRTTGAVTVDGLIVGSAVRVDGVAIGTLVQAIVADGELEIAFNDAATPERVQSLIRALTFESENSAAPTGNRTVEIRLAGPQLDVTLTMTVQVQAPAPPSSGGGNVIDTNMPANHSGNVTITATGVVTGGSLGGTVTNNGTISGEVTLQPGTTVNGGIISGKLTGDAEQPAQINAATITTGAELSNVVIGANTVLEPGVNLGPNVKFESDASIPSGTDLTGALKSIQWLTGDERQLVDLNDEVLAARDDQSPVPLITSIQLIGDLVGSDVAQIQSGEIEVVTDDFRAMVLPVSVRKADPDVPEGIHINDNGDVILVTGNRRVVVAYPVLADQQAFTQALQAMGLQMQYDTRANMVVSASGEQSAELDDAGVALLALETSHHYYSGRPDVLALPAHRGTQAELLEYPMPELGTVTGISLLFEAGDGRLLEQDIVPVPVDWAALREAIAAMEGVDSVRIGTDGVIVAMVDGVVIRGRVDYVVHSGAAETQETQLHLVGDLTGNGMDDYEITYTNGDRQLLFIYPLE